MKTTTKHAAYLTAICFSIIVLQGTFLSGLASAATFSPGYLSTAPVIDGVKETAWDAAPRDTVQVSFPGQDTSRPLRVHVSLFGDYVYFGLWFQRTAHHLNESFAVFCSNHPPANQSALQSIFDYDSVKAVNIDGTSFDMEVLRAENRTRPNPDGNRMDFSVARDASNYTFYEFRFRLEANRTGDISWTPGAQYLFRLYHGTVYFNQSHHQSGQPNFTAWTPSGSVFTIDIPEPGTSPIETGITAGEFNTLVAKITMIIASMVVFFLVGTYVVGSKKRISRR